MCSSHSGIEYLKLRWRHLMVRRFWEALLDLDETMSARIVLPPCARPFLKAVEYAVHGFPWIIAAVVTAVFAYSYRWAEKTQYGILVLIIGLVLDLAMIGLIKILVQRDRPSQNVDDQVFEAPIADRYSFPSGHTSRSAMLAVLLAHLCPPLTPLAVLLPLLVGYSRIAMGRHYVGDVIAGIALGVIEGFVVLCTPMAVNRWVRRLFL